MTAVVTRRLGDRVDAIDLFCGFGGSSQGIHAAGADVRLAANHNDLALDCHAANFPDTDHVRADLSNPDAADYHDPKDLPPASFLWASPSCKFHSPANARKVYLEGPQQRLFSDGEEFDEEQYANSERSRVTMMCPLRYASFHRPEIVVVENVLEVTAWGPARDGSTFRWWVKEWDSLGYNHRCLFLNSQFFAPCPQSRDRIYIVFWRKGNQEPDLDYRPPALCTSDQCGGTMVEGRQVFKPRTAAWLLPEWGKYEAQYTYACPDCHQRVHPVAWPAYTAIDWSVLGPTIGERQSNGMKPLAPATMDRIRRGLMKFRGGPPIIIPAKSVWGQDRHALQPFSTQTTQQDKALVTGAVIPVRGMPEYDRSGSLHGSIPTLTSSGRSVYMATEGVTLPVAGNTHERPGQIRAKDLRDPTYTQHTTLAFGFAYTPFHLQIRGGGSKESGQQPVTDSIRTVSAEGLHHAIASPAIWSKFNGAPGDTAWHAVSDRLGTITAKDTTGLVVLPWVDDFRSSPHLVTEQLATVMSHARQALASVENVGEPITDEDLQRVCFRMLEPDPELRRAMAFGDDYVLLGNKTQRTAGLGNAVTPPVAGWITARCLETLR